MFSAKFKNHFFRDISSGPTNLQRVFIGLLFLVILAGRGEFDPDPLNLVRPLGGPRNWLGLPGALIAGAAVNILGKLSLLIPLVLIFLQDRKIKSRTAGYLKDILWILLADSWLGLLFASLYPAGAPFLAEIAGIWGYSSVKALEIFPGKFASLLIIFIFAFRRYKSYSLNLSVFIIVWPTTLNLLSRVQSIRAGLSKRAAGIRSRFFNKNIFKSFFSKSKTDTSETDAPPEGKNEKQDREAGR